MRILIFNWKDPSPTHSPGLGVFTEEVARALVQRGHSVTLFAAAVAGARAPEGRGSRSSAEAASASIAPHATSGRPKDRGRFDVIVDEINTRPFLTPHFVHDVPIVALIHQLAREIWFVETPFPVSVLGRYVLEPRWLRPYRDVPAITVSQSSADSLSRHHGWRDITVVPEGLALHPPPEIPKEPDPTVVFLGRLVAMKQPAHALEGFAALSRRIPTAQLWVIGDGPLLGRLRKRASERVSFLGRIDRSELRERLARAHVLVSTSIREGWGLNVSEAAALGTPALGYAVPGLVDSLAASGGATVQPSPEALGEALIDFFSGRLVLHPTISTVPWAEVAVSVERRLERAIREADRP
jgi:glycosyltransferase involved in cell wall biosynthesis